MFGFEEHGYNKNEVDEYISKLKAELIQKKLSILSSEQKVLDLQQKQNEIDLKEQNLLKVLKAIQQANKVQEESSKNLLTLINKKNVLLEEKVKDFIDYLKDEYPEIFKDEEISFMSNELNELVKMSKEEKNVKLKENESVKNLINKVKKNNIESKIIKVERTNLNLFDDAKNVDEFLAKDPQTDELYKNVAIESTSFDLKEAVNPKEDLDEIMKAFDFFGNSGDE